MPEPIPHPSRQDTRSALAAPTQQKPRSPDGVRPGHQFLVTRFGRKVRYVAAYVVPAGAVLGLVGRGMGGCEGSRGRGGKEGPDKVEGEESILLMARDKGAERAWETPI